MTNYFSGAISGVSTVWQGNTFETINIGGLQQAPDRLDACIAALGQTDPRDDRDALLARAPEIAEGSFHWVLEDKTFKTWLSEERSDQPLIWLSGGPGMGKTRLAIFITQHLEQHMSAHDDIWTLYVFCERQHEHRNTAASILKSFIYQLYKKNQELGKIFYEKYKHSGESLLQPHSVQSLWIVFRDMVNKSPVKRIFCVIDGIDGCEESNLNHFMILIKKLFARAKERQLRNEVASDDHGGRKFPVVPESTPANDPKMRIFILTREKPDCVMQHLQSFPKLALTNGEKQIQISDLKRCIDANVEKVSTHHAGSTTSSKKTTEIITKALNDGQDRSFLWINLVAEKLMNMTHNQMKKFVTRIPESVEAMHVETLLEVPHRQRPQIFLLLKWLALAARPLSVLELTKAIKYSQKTAFTVKTLKKLLKSCPGLVQRHGPTVILADQSVQELLLSDKSPLRDNAKLKSFVFGKSDGHSELTNTCVTYLQESANLEQSRRVRLKPGDKLKTDDLRFLRKHPFLEYAIVHWTYHAKQGNHERTDYGATFFKDESARRRLWWESYWISLRQSFAWKWTAPGGFSLLHLAAFFDIVPLALYLDQKVQIHQLLGTEDNQGMKPINWATEKSQAAMVKFLVERGDFDDEALRQAARTGEVSIMKMLLENREKILRSPEATSPMPSPGSSSSPLQAMRKFTLNSISGFAKKLDQTNDVQSTMSPMSPGVGGYGKTTSETPLHIAATCGHDEAIEVLLKAGEDFYQTTDGGWTALHNAAWFGRVSIIERLVKAGADANARSKEGLTPLHCAVKNSQDRVVESLLRAQVVDIEAEDQFGLTPFHMACKANNTDIMEILLDYGASIEKRMRQGWTPLMWACMNGKFPVVQTLLKRGADVCVKWVCHHYADGKAIELSPLALAKVYKHEGIAHLVEKFGGIETGTSSNHGLKTLPLAETTEEHYDLPVVHDIEVVKEDGVVDDATFDAHEYASSVESDAESDDGIEFGNGDGLTRELSVGEIHTGVETGAESSSTPQGLGLRGVDEGNDEMGAGSGVQLDKQIPDVDPVNEDLTPNNPEAMKASALDQGHVVGESRSRTASEDFSRKSSTPGIGGEEPGQDGQDHSKDRDESSNKLSKTLGSFGDRLSRFVPKRSLKRTGSAASDEKLSSDEAADNDSGLVEQVGAIHAAADSEVTKGTGSREHFSARRLFSWKEEGTDEVNQTASPESIEVRDPLDTPGHTETIPQEQSLPESHDPPNAADDELRAESTPGEVAKSGRFSAKRMFSWKSASTERDSPTASSTKLETGLVVIDKDEAPGQIVGS